MKRKVTNFAQVERILDDYSKTQTELESGKENVRKCANLREILLPFFRQCIWGGGAPSAVQ